MSFSKEWNEQNNKGGEGLFSVKTEFRKLKEGGSIQKICNGYGFDTILNREDECFVLIKGKEVSFRELSGMDLQKPNGKLRIAVIIGVFLIVGFWLLAWLLIEFGFTKHEERGTFGDMFGSINALYSGLALGGIILTIFLQKKELKYQRRELRETRREFEIQNETLKIQKFENTFFNLIRNHSQMMDTLSEKREYSSDTVVDRYRALEEIKGKFSRDLKELNTVLTERVIRGTNYLDGFPQALFDDLDEYQPIAEDSLITLKFIDKSEVDDKALYFKVLQNSFSVPELYLFSFYLEFSEEAADLSESIKQPIQMKYKKDSGALTSEIVLPPKISFIRENFQFERGKMSVPLNQLDKWASNLDFGFVNEGVQKIQLKKFKVYKERNIPFIDVDKEVDVTKDSPFKFKPLEEFKNEILRMQTHEINEIKVRFEMVVECEISGEYIIEQSVSINNPRGHSTAHISSHFYF
ncbi:MAG: hypothetical protein MK105_17650 [Crocinitomicaceae bacterium]|nr:hypothetical protein [Crocinitomicaceae bacterium]